MKLISVRTLPIIAIITLLSILDTGCQSKSKDAEIKAAVEKRLKEDSTTAKIMVDVKDSVVTLSGECLNQSKKEDLTRVTETVSYVKSVINNCTVSDTSMTDKEMNDQIWKLTENITTIKIATDSGIIHLAGNLRKGEWDSLKTSLDKLHPKGYDTQNLSLE
ncbi:MAG: BON domain-containing protein [Chitinophagales bacterium]